MKKNYCYNILILNSYLFNNFEIGNNVHISNENESTFE